MGDFDNDKIPTTNFLLNKENDFDFYKCIGNDIKFDYIVSSHNLEHFPNLINSLISLGNVLGDNGKIIAFLPDCRFTFDKYRHITQVTKIISDYYLNKTKPSFEELIEQRMHWHNLSTKDLWIKHNASQETPSQIADNCLIKEKDLVLTEQINKGNDKKAITLIFEEHSTDNYIDAHVNCFTPDSFKHIIDILFKLEYITLKIESLYPTVEGSHEFAVILTK